MQISIPDMIASWGNAERFFARVGALSFPEPAELAWLIALTLGLVLTGTLLAAALSVPIAYLAASNTTPGNGWRAAARFAGVLARAVPDVVLAMVFVLMFSLGALPGILAIGIHSIGMISKMFADAIEQIDEGPRLAIRAAGGTRMQEFFGGILPQVLPSWVATVLHRNDINLRGSVVLGYVGVAGLGLEMSYAFKSLNYGLGLGIALVIFVLCVVMEIVSSAVRAAMLGRVGDRGSWADRLVGRRLVREQDAAARRPAPRPAAGWARSPQTALRRPWTSERVRNVAAGWLAAAIVIAGVWVCQINWGDFLTFWAKIPAVAVQFWPPTFGVYGAEVMFEALRETIAIALAATLLALGASLLLGSFAARNVAPNGGIRGAARFALVGIRGIPEIILAIVLIVITGPRHAGRHDRARGRRRGPARQAHRRLVRGSRPRARARPLRHRRDAAPGVRRRHRAAGRPGARRPHLLPARHEHPRGDDPRHRRRRGVGYYLLNASQGANYGMVTAIVLMILVTVLVIEGIAMWMRKVFR